MAVVASGGGAGGGGGRCVRDGCGVVLATVVRWY